MMKMDQESIRCWRLINTAGKPYMTDDESAGETTSKLHQCASQGRGKKAFPLTSLSYQEGGRKVNLHQLFMWGEPEVSAEFPVTARQRKHGEMQIKTVFERIHYHYVIAVWKPASQPASRSASTPISPGGRPSHRLDAHTPAIRRTSH